METRANYALIGAFVIMAATAVLAFVLWLGTSQFNREFKQYDIVFPGPVVLEEGASVRYIGITVGEVETVRIDPRDPSKVRARIRVDRTTPVKADSTAIIDFAGITGLTFVQITAGSDTAGPLLPKPYQDIPEIPAGATPLAALFDGGTEIVGKASVALDQLSAVITPDNVEALSATLDNIQMITAMLADEDSALMGQTLNTLASLDRAGDSLSDASTTVTQTAASLQTELVTLNAELTALVKELNAATGEAKSTLAESRKAITAATTLIEGPTSATLTETSLAVQELQVLISRLDRVARDLETNPQGFVLGNPAPYED